MFELEFSNKSKNFLKKQEKEICSRILEKLKELCENPFPKNCKRVEGRKEKIFRIRVGEFRILYLMLNDKNKILISNIDKRSKVYE